MRRIFSSTKRNVALHKCSSKNFLIRTYTAAARCNWIAIKLFCLWNLDWEPWTTIAIVTLRSLFHTIWRARKKWLKSSACREIYFQKKRILINAARTGNSDSTSLQPTLFFCSNSEGGENLGLGGSGAPRGWGRIGGEELGRGRSVNHHNGILAFLVAILSGRHRHGACNKFSGLADLCRSACEIR